MLNLRCISTERPLFIPSLKEYKAWLIGETPSRVACDAGLLARAALAEYELLRADAVTIGLDAYNIEAEAAGSRVRFFSDASVPALEADGHRLAEGDDPARLALPDPLHAGRMPMVLDACRRVVRELGGRVWIRAALSGPLSLATGLMGLEAFHMAVLTDPERVTAVLDYAEQVALRYGTELLKTGCGLALFESQASPDLVSPEFFREWVAPRLRSLVAGLTQRGAGPIALIIGGDTTPIIPELIASGANNLLCDFSARWPAWLAAAQAAGRAVRRNLRPALLREATPDDVYQAARALIGEAHGYRGLIVGTSVVPYGTPAEKLLAVRQACHEGFC